MDKFDYVLLKVNIKRSTSNVTLNFLVLRNQTFYFYKTIEIVFD